MFIYQNCFSLWGRSPQTHYRAFSPGPHWGTFVSQTPSSTVPPTVESWLRQWCSQIAYNALASGSASDPAEGAYKCIAHPIPFRGHSGLVSVSPRGLRTFLCLWTYRVMVRLLANHSLSLGTRHTNNLTSIPWAVRLTWLENAYSRPLFWLAILTCKVITLTQILAWDHGYLVDLCMQDYKSLCAAAAICSTLVDIQSFTHRQYLTSLHVFDKLSQLS